RARYTLSLHDALPISLRREHGGDAAVVVGDQRHRADVEFGAAIHRAGAGEMTAAEPDDAPFRFDRRLTGKAHLGADAAGEQRALDRKSTRLNSSHLVI